MAKRNAANFLHDKMAPMMGPALIVLITSNIFRGLLGVIIATLTSTFGTYSHWSPFFRLPVDVVVFLGVVLSGEICYSNTSSTLKGYKKMQHEILNEDAPKFKGDAAQQTAQALAYQKNKDQRISFVDKEVNTERLARNTFAVISGSYAVNFIIQSIFHFDDSVQNAIIGAFGVLSVIASFYAIWYYGSRFKEERADPAETGVSMMETAMEKRLEAVSTNFSTGTPTDEDLNLADVALPSKHPYRRFVPALRKRPDVNDVLTTKDVFISLGVEDQTVQRAIRRAIKLSFDSHVPGVYQEIIGAKTEWRISGAAYYQVLKKFLSDGQGMDKVRTNHARHRALRKEMTGQAPDSDQPIAGQSDAMMTDQEMPTPIVEPAVVLATVHDDPITILTPPFSIDLASE